MWDRDMRSGVALLDGGDDAVERVADGAGQTEGKARWFGGLLGGVGVAVGDVADVVGDAGDVVRGDDVGAYDVEGIARGPLDVVCALRVKRQKPQRYKRRWGFLVEH